MSEYGSNIWGDVDEIEESVRGKRLRRAEGATLAAAVWELDPGADIVYHFHHGNEELLIVLRGRPTLRTPDGERELDEGDVVHFAPGPEGAHGVSNRSDSVVRYVMAGAHVSPEVIEYPDQGRLVAMSRSGLYYDSTAQS